MKKKMEINDEKRCVQQDLSVSEVPAIISDQKMKRKSILSLKTNRNKKTPEAKCKIKESSRNATKKEDENLDKTNCIKKNIFEIMMNSTNKQILSKVSKHQQVAESKNNSGKKRNRQQSSEREESIFKKRKKLCKLQSDSEDSVELLPIATKIDDNSKNLEDFQIASERTFPKNSPEQVAFKQTRLLNYLGVFDQIPTQKDCITKSNKQSKKESGTVTLKETKKVSISSKECPLDCEKVKFDIGMETNKKSETLKKWKMKIRLLSTENVENPNEAFDKQIICDDIIETEHQKKLSKHTPKHKAHVKTKVANNNVYNVVSLENVMFPSVSHVTQRDFNNTSKMNVWSLPEINWIFKIVTPLCPYKEEMTLGTITNSLIRTDSSVILKSQKKTESRKKLIKKLKKSYPDDVVFKYFNLLKQKNINFSDSCAEYVQLTDKYKPTSFDDLIGNNNSTLELRNWLKRWKEFNYEVISQPRKRLNSGSSSDFISSDDDSRDTTDFPTNAILLVGPHGSGKTAVVYSLCKELELTVLEVNASTRRTGKFLLQQLQEATQSHQVKRKESNWLTSFSKNKKQKKKDERDESKICVLLIEDVDIVFERDDGFISALNQLLITSKRPIILTTTNVQSTYVQKLLIHYPLIQLNRCPPQLLSVWLQVLCLVEGLQLPEHIIYSMLWQNNCDIRQSLLQLQFLNCTKEFERKFPPEDLNLVWWNLADALNFPVLHSKNVMQTDSDANSNDNEEIKQLKNVSEMFESLVLTDVILTKVNFKSDWEPTPQDWQLQCIDGLNLLENFQTYSENTDTAINIANTLLNSCINSCDVFKTVKNIVVPHYEELKWREKHYECRKSLSEAFPSHSIISHDALGLDYYPTLRAICKSEANGNVNKKRNNRFCSYLHNLNIVCNDSIIKTACNVFCVE